METTVAAMMTALALVAAVPGRVGRREAEAGGRAGKETSPIVTMKNGAGDGAEAEAGTIAQRSTLGSITEGTSNGAAAAAAAAAAVATAVVHARRMQSLA